MEGIVRGLIVTVRHPTTGRLVAHIVVRSVVPEYGHGWELVVLDELEHRAQLMERAKQCVSKMEKCLCFQELPALRNAAAQRQDSTTDV